jgi:hypothetical protein
MDERYLMATVRYVELNPVKVMLCSKAEEWYWSSAMPYLMGCKMTYSMWDQYWKESQIGRPICQSRELSKKKSGPKLIIK